jgi:hypothetical protein
MAPLTWLSRLGRRWLWRDVLSARATAHGAPRGDSSQARDFRTATTASAEHCATASKVSEISTRRESSATVGLQSRRLSIVWVTPFSEYLPGIHNKPVQRHRRQGRADCKTGSDGDRLWCRVPNVHDGQYALESRHRNFVLAFACGCALSSTYGFLSGAWPFGAVEAIWTIVAVKRFTGQIRSRDAGLVAGGPRDSYEKAQSGKPKTARQ